MKILVDIIFCISIHSKLLTVAHAEDDGRYDIQFLEVQER